MHISSDAIVRIVVAFYPDTEAIYVFGTHGTQDESLYSDVDIALLFPHSRSRQIGNIAVSDCRYALENELKKEVDLINLRQVNTVFQHEILQNGRIIYCRDENTIDHFEMAVMSSYQKLNEERADILQDILKSGRILNI